MVNGFRSWHHTFATVLDGMFQAWWFLQRAIYPVADFVPLGSPEVSFVKTVSKEQKRKERQTNKETFGGWP